MATYYSILSVLIRPEIQEKISIGFLLMSEGKVYFNYSNNKLSVAKTLLDENAYRLLKDSLKNIEATAIKQGHELSKKVSNQTVIDKSFLRTVFTNSYIEYLSNYNNNTIAFSSPKEIDLNASPSVFNKLFLKYVDDTEKTVEAVTQPKSIDTFKVTNRVRLSKYFNIDKQITSEQIQYLIAPVRVDLVGMNLQPVYAKSVDFEKHYYHIKEELSEIFFLYHAFKLQNKNSEAYVLSMEPSKKDSDKHRAWKELRSYTQWKNVDVSEAEQIIEYAEEHNVQPLIPETEEKEG